VVILAVSLYVASSAERAQRSSKLWCVSRPPAIRDRARGWAAAFVAGLEALRSPTALAIVVLTSTVAWLLEPPCTSWWRLLQPREAFPIYLMVAAAANLAITVPSTSAASAPSRHWPRKRWSLWASAASAAAAYAVALHALLLLPVVAVGLVFLWAINLSLGEALRRPTQPALASSAGPTEAAE